jgi:hypothetical protein
MVFQLCLIAEKRWRREAACAMSFLDTIDRAKTYLEKYGRISLRALKREFDLDNDADLFLSRKPSSGLSLNLFDRLFCRLSFCHRISSQLAPGHLLSHRLNWSQFR